MTKSARSTQKPKPKKQSQNVSKAYEPTPQERAVIDEFFLQKRQKRPAPGLKLNKESERSVIAIDHEDDMTGLTLLMSALGTTSGAFTEGMLLQLASAGHQGQADDTRGMNFMLSVVKGVEPTDEIEAMLAAQMAAVHLATMTFARRLTNVETIQQQDSAERAFNKLARTFTAQIEALKRYRTGGEQKVTVEHVTVNEGGQAIVGNVSSGGRGASKKAETTP